jgi:hypothetical protein
VHADVEVSCENAPAALIWLYEGKNLGKQLVKVRCLGAWAGSAVEGAAG